MKKVSTLLATTAMVSVVLFSFTGAAAAAFVPNPGPAQPTQPAPSQPAPTQPAPAPQQYPQQTMPQYVPSPFDGVWQYTAPNGAVGYLLFAGNQYQIWANNQMTEAGTFTVQGNTFYEQPNNGQARSENFQLSPDGMTLTILGPQGNTVFQKVQQGMTPQQPAQPYPQQPAQTYPPQTTVPPATTYPQQPGQTYPQQTTMPQQNLQVQLQGTWSANMNGTPALFVFAGNQFAVSLNNQTVDYGTFTIQGNVIYYNSTTGVLKDPVLIQMSPDGRTMTASDTNGANPLMWTKTQ